MPFGSFMLSRLSQFQNALSPIYSTPSGIFICIRLVHSRNALSPMCLTELGIFIPLNDAQTANASSSIFISPDVSTVLVQFVTELTVS